MMAFDRPPISARLEQQTYDQLREVLGQSLRRGNHVEELQALLRRTAEEAHAKGLHAEQLLIILKEIWYSLPELRESRGEEVEVTLLQELVTRCIQQYYAD